MKILCLLTRDFEDTGTALRLELARAHSVDVIDLRREMSFDRVVDEIAAADRVICW